MKADIPKPAQKRIVIIGGGFAGLTLLRQLPPNFQIFLVDQFNYHQFQPLFYQVATSGLEPSAISFPLRKLIQRKSHMFIRITRVTAIDPGAKKVHTEVGEISYDYLIIAAGVETNFFGNEKLKEKSYSMKSVPEALLLRNSLLQNLESALISEDPDERRGLLTVVVIGGGPTGVELSGALAEMKKYVLPKDYPELDFNDMQIHLVEAMPELLNGMTKRSSEKALEYLRSLGVEVALSKRVIDYDGRNVKFSDNSCIRSNMMVWAAGVRAVRFAGLPPEVFGPGGRIAVDDINRVKGMDDVFAIGDIAFMTEQKFPDGHPQVAQVAIQQAKLLARNLTRLEAGDKPTPFAYHDKGTMATVGRNLAVADLSWISFHGFIAWLIWMFIHLVSLIGFKNKVFTFLNWIWNYITYDQSLRLIIQPKKSRVDTESRESSG
jgi:NADH:ubiquinone reductase (H+-translocating)